MLFRSDDFDDIRAEYTAILQKQLASGNNGIVKTKYLTFTIEADSLKTARARLTRIGLDLLGYFKTMGCVAHVMDGQERLEVLQNIYFPLAVLHPIYATQLTQSKTEHPRKKYFFSS